MQIDRLTLLYAAKELYFWLSASSLSHMRSLVSVLLSCFDVLVEFDCIGY